MDKNIRKGIAVTSIVMSAMVVVSCSSGSVGSDVGDEDNAAPLAVAQILNGGDTTTFRTGAEVLLTGKDSEDPDGPIIGFSWSGPSNVRLREKNSSTVAFTVPNVADGSQLAFSLIVTDSDGVTGTGSVSVTVRNARDPDRFLSNSLSKGSTDANVFFVQPVRSQTAAGGDTTYSVSVESFVVYPQAGSAENCRDLQVTIPTESEVSSGRMTGSQCLITRQADLATGNSEIQGSWPADPDSPLPTPIHELKIPKTDAGSLIPYEVARDARDRILDLYAVPRSYHLVRAQVTPGDIGYLDAVALSVQGIDANQNPAITPVVTETELDSSGASKTAWVDIDSLFQGIAGVESVESAEAYIQAVDPAGKRQSLNDWLCNARFMSPGDCNAGQATGARRLRPEALAGQDVGSEFFAHATYLNNYDLGFGRDMYSRIDGETGYVYSFVNNYATLELALRKGDPIVAVVMEFTPAEDANGDFVDNVPIVKFFTYAPDGTGDMQLVTSMNFDGRGEVVTPGNCVTCHGGTDPGSVAAGQTDLDSTFLPWDVDSFFFMENDPAIRDAMPRLDGSTLLEELRALESNAGEFSTANQLDQIRKLNTAALATYTHENVDQARYAGSYDLLGLWYEDQDTIQVGSQMRDMQVLLGDFDGSKVPESWQEATTNIAGTDQIYQDVFAKNCRMCHTSILPNSDASFANNDARIDSYEEFVRRLGCLTSDVGDPVLFRTDACAEVIFDEGKMPAARLTDDRFWVDTNGSQMAPADILRDHLGALGPTISDAPTAQAIITIGGSRINNSLMVVRRGDSVDLSGRSSNFADSYSWSVAPATTLTRPSASTTSFVPDDHGVYSVTLELNAEPATTATADIEVFNYVPATVGVQRSVSANSGTISIPLLPGTSFSPDCTTAVSPDCDPSASVAVNQSPDAVQQIGILAEGTAVGSAACSGGGTLANCPSGVVSYTPDVSGPTYRDVFNFTITDVDGDQASAQIIVDFTETLSISATFNALSVYSDIDEMMSIDLSGGAASAPQGSDRYSITCSSRALGGRLTGGLAGCGPTNPVTTSSAVVNFEYESDQPNGSPNYTRSATANQADRERFTITVTDSQDNSDAVMIEFELRPQVRFNATSPTPFNFSIYSILTAGTQVNNDNCTRCHDGGTSPNFSQPASTVYSDANRLAKNPPSTPQDPGTLNVNSPIVCEASNDSVCIPPLSHDGGKILLQPGINAIKRWINEGALAN